MEEYKMKSFSIYADYYELIDNLSDKEQGELLVAINKYMFKDIIPELKGMNKAIFNNLKRPLDKQKTKSKSGSKQKQNENETDNEMKTKQKQNENETSIKIDNETKTKQKRNENETDNETDNTLYGNGSSYYDSNNYDNGNGNVNGNVYSFIETNYSRNISGYEYELITTWLKEFNEDIVKYAIELSIEKNKKTFSYVKGILNNWKTCNYKTLQEIKENEKVKPKEIDKKELYLSYMEGIDD